MVLDKAMNEFIFCRAKARDNMCLRRVFSSQSSYPSDTSANQVLICNSKVFTITTVFNDMK